VSARDEAGKNGTTGFEISFAEDWCEEVGEIPIN
jgi:hypothetical protein